MALSQSNILLVSLVLLVLVPLNDAGYSRTYLRREQSAVEGTFRRRLQAENAVKSSSPSLSPSAPPVDDLTKPPTPKPPVAPTPTPVPASQAGTTPSKSNESKVYITELIKTDLGTVDKTPVSSAVGLESFTDMLVSFSEDDPNEENDRNDGDPDEERDSPNEEVPIDEEDSTTP